MIEQCTYLMDISAVRIFLWPCSTHLSLARLSAWLASITSSDASITVLTVCRKSWPTLSFRALMSFDRLKFETGWRRNGNKIWERLKKKKKKKKNRRIVQCCIRLMQLTLVCEATWHCWLKSDKSSHDYKRNTWQSETQSSKHMADTITIPPELYPAFRLEQQNNNRNS